MRVTAPGDIGRQVASGADLSEERGKMRLYIREGL